MEGEKDPHNCVQRVRQKTIVLSRFITFPRNAHERPKREFPKDRHSREKWLSFCGIGEKDLNTVTFLCSNHFKEEDLTKRINCVIVNPGAILFIKTQKRKKRYYLIKLISNTTDDKYQPLMKKHNWDEMSIVEASTSSDNSQTVANIVSTLIE
ncbi:hypothetical protein DMN91_000229, partial [Ooceraea biroi]